jgi:hypothetical protein
MIYRTENGMQNTKYVTESLAAALDRPPGEHAHRASAADDGLSAIQAHQREETRKYVERVNRYLARDDGPRPAFGDTTN